MSDLLLRLAAAAQGRVSLALPRPGPSASSPAREDGSPDLIEENRERYWVDGRPTGEERTRRVDALTGAPVAAPPAVGTRAPPIPWPSPRSTASRMEVPPSRRGASFSDSVIDAGSEPASAPDGPEPDRLPPGAAVRKELPTLFAARPFPPTVPAGPGSPLPPMRATAAQTPDEPLTTPPAERHGPPDLPRLPPASAPRPTLPAGGQVAAAKPSAETRPLPAWPSQGQAVHPVAPLRLEQRKPIDGTDAEAPPVVLSRRPSAVEATTSVRSAVVALETDRESLRGPASSAFPQVERERTGPRRAPLAPPAPAAESLIDQIRAFAGQPSMGQTRIPPGGVSTPQSDTVVHIKIARIEVHAAPAPVEPVDPRPALTPLAELLRRREGE